MKMEVLTIEQLNSIDSKKNKQDHEQQKINRELPLCLNEIAFILKTEWHNASKEFYGVVHKDLRVYSGKVFSLAAQLYKENGIEISFYHPTSYFSFKLMK